MALWRYRSGFIFIRPSLRPNERVDVSVNLVGLRPQEQMTPGNGFYLGTHGPHSSLRNAHINHPIVLSVQDQDGNPSEVLHGTLLVEDGWKPPCVLFA